MSRRMFTALALKDEKGERSEARWGGMVGRGERRRDVLFPWWIEKLHILEDFFRDNIDGIAWHHLQRGEGAAAAAAAEKEWTRREGERGGLRRDRESTFSLRKRYISSSWILSIPVSIPPLLHSNSQLPTDREGEQRHQVERRRRRRSMNLR
jgi:hypothetical protein